MLRMSDLIGSSSASQFGIPLEPTDSGLESGWMIALVPVGALGEPPLTGRREGVIW